MVSSKPRLSLSRLCVWLTVVPLAGCPASESRPATTKVTLSSGRGDRTLTYSCGHFERQARAPEDIAVLYENLAPAIRELQASKDTAAVVTLASSAQSHDIERLEVLLVERLCANSRAAGPAP